MAREGMKQLAGDKWLIENEKQTTIGSCVPYFLASDCTNRHTSPKIATY